MANIHQLDVGSLDIRPTETGVESFAAAGRRIGSFYSQAAESMNEVASIRNDLASRIGGAIKDAGDAALQFEDHREISAGAKNFAELQDKLTTQWNQKIAGADPNDPSVAAGFRENVLEPALDAFKEGFATERSQQWAEAHTEELRTVMYHKTSADMSSLAAVAVKNNINKATTAMTNTALQDPSQVDFLLQSVDHSIAGMISSSPNIKGIDAVKAQSEISEDTKGKIVKAGAIGAIQKSANPEATADQWIKKYPNYINGDEAKALAGNARQQIRANNYDIETNRRRDKEIAQDKSNEATNQYLINVRSQDPRLVNDPTAKKILNDPTLTKTDKNNLLNYIDRQAKPETDSRISQQTFTGLLREMRQPNADTDAVMQKAWDARLTDAGKPGSMTEHDFNQFREEVVARKTPEGAALERDRAQFFKQYAGTIAGTSYDPVQGSPKLYAAEMDARRMEQTLRQKGLDPHLAYDPASEYFLGRNERLAKYQGSMQQDLQEQSAAPSAPSAATPSGKPPTPQPLRGIAALSYSKTRNMWRDDTTGKIYNADGSEAKK